MSKENSNLRTFYLQELSSEHPLSPGRTVIDDHMHEGATEVDQVIAASWRDARAHFFGNLP